LNRRSTTWADGAAPWLVAHIRGREFADGATVALNYASANRDAAKFGEPDVFDVSRSPNQHLALELGIYKCVGRPLARLELRMVIAELPRRTSAMASTAHPSAARRSRPCFARSR
jgi:cytochrome P450